MALVIRLSLSGKKGQPLYRVVVTEKRSKRDGGVTEIIGHYNPNLKPPKLDIKTDRLDYWTKQGAIPSASLRRLLVK